MFTAGQVVVQLIVAQVALKLSTLATVRRWSKQTSRPRRTRSSLSELRPDLHLVSLVARHRLVAMFGVDCVAESVVVERYLRRNGIPAEFRLGVQAADINAAHAWIETRGVPVNASPDVHDRFVAFDGAVPGDHPKP